MGLLDRQKAKTDRSIQEACADRLEPGEQVATAFVAMNRIPWWPLLLLLPVAVYLEVEKGFERPWWFTGVVVGGLLAIFLRYHFVVLTDRRLLVLHLRWMSQKTVASETAVGRGEATAELGRRMINLKLRLKAGASRNDLLVARQYWPEAEKLVTELKGSPAPSGG